MPLELIVDAGETAIECYSRLCPSLTEILSGSPEDFGDPNDPCWSQPPSNDRGERRALLPAIQGHGREVSSTPKQGTELALSGDNPTHFSFKFMELLSLG